MSQFTVRVELHDAQWADYDTLHAAIEQCGFSRLITSDAGQTYQLPWADTVAAAPCRAHRSVTSRESQPTAQASKMRFL